MDKTEFDTAIAEIEQKIHDADIEDGYGVLALNIKDLKAIISIAKMYIISEEN